MQGQRRALPPTQLVPYEADSHEHLNVRASQRFQLWKLSGRFEFRGLSDSCSRALLRRDGSDGRSLSQAKRAKLTSRVSASFPTLVRRRKLSCLTAPPYPPIIWTCSFIFDWRSTLPT